MKTALAPPNLLTYARLLLVPLLGAAIIRLDCSLALVLIAFAGLTDAADGSLARRFGWSSRLGAYLDPVADKLLLVTVYICLAVAQLAPLWLLVIVLSRDVLILAMVGAALLFTAYREFPPLMAGKISTIVQVGAAFGLLLLCAIPAMPEQPSRMLLIWGAAAATLWSGAAYLARGLRMWRRRDRNSPA